MKRILFGITFVLALAVAPKAHAIGCSGALYGDVVVNKAGTTTYWESCDVGDGTNQWERVSYIEFWLDQPFMEGY